MTKLLHHIWLGPAELPADHARWIREWKSLHPDWEHRLWTEDDTPRFPLYARHAGSMITPAARSTLLRTCILGEMGGLSVDTDVQPLAPVTDILHAALLGHRATAAVAPFPNPLPITHPEATRELWCDHLHYVQAGSPYALEFLRILRRSIFGPDPCGPAYQLTHIVSQNGHPLAILPPETCGWQNPGEDRPVPADPTHCIHHAAASWIPTAEKHGVPVFPRKPLQQPTT